MAQRIQNNGLNEGLARGISQALTYIFELHKTSIQVYGRSPLWTPSQWALNISRGIWQSSFTAGFVFHSYFSIYHAVSNTPCAALAGPIASFLTSGIKIPIGNCMRVVQAKPKTAPTIIHAALAITRNRGPAGLYSGYLLSLLEDIIEMDVRIRLYDAGKQFCIENANIQNSCKNKEPLAPVSGFAIGAAAGAVAAAITTPFDTLRAHMAFQACHTKTKQTGVQILASLCGTAGPSALYRGVHMRAASTGIKAALFYSIYEALQAL